MSKVKGQKYKSKVKNELSCHPELGSGSADSGQARMTEGRSRNKFGMTIVTFAFFLLTLRPVFAQQVSLSISPPLLELVIKPGKSVLIAYRIGNFGDPTIMKARVLPFVPVDSAGNIVLKEEFEGPIRFSLDNADIQLDQAVFLNTKASQQFLLRIRVPEGAPEGDYYYTFFGEAQPATGTEGTSASRAQARIGSNILITVSRSGRVDIKGKIAQFEVLSRFTLKLFEKSWRFFDSGDKIPVILIAANEGRNLVKPQGEIVLRGNFGEKATYKVHPQNVLSGSQRLLSATPSAEVNCDVKKPPAYCRRPISLLLSGFFLGSYKLSTTLSFAEGAQNVFAQTSFIAFPFKFVLGLFGALFVVALIVKRVRE
ncbi:hypothetical protein HYT33_01450 [Candidatus Roizmanbacteria bacterium]|nr:hypothetical protein [Candidatus Roizmanbacteria bacterium]